VNTQAVVINKLAITVHTNMILLASTRAVLADVVMTAFRTRHRNFSELAPVSSETIVQKYPVI
jgi:hypothetical protein